MIFILFAGGALLRVFLLATPHAFWGDEVASILCAKTSFLDTVLFNVFDTHPPFYFVILHAAMRTLGFHAWVFRLPSLAAGIAALAGIYLFTKELYDRRTARLVLWLTAISPLAMHMSQQVRNHGPVLAFTSFGSWFFLKMVSHPSRRIWGYGFAVFALLAVATTHFAWMWLAVLFFVHGRLIWKRELSLATVWYPFVFLLFSLPLVLLLFEHTGHYTFACKPLVLPSWHLSVITLRNFLHVVWYFAMGPVFLVSHMKAGYALSLVASSPLFAGFLATFIAACAVMVLRVLKDRSAKDFRSSMLVCLFALPVVLIDLLDFDTFYSRYFSFVFFAWMALLAWSLVSVRVLWLRRLMIAALSATSLIGTLFVIYFPADPMMRERFIDACRYFSTHTNEKDLILWNPASARIHLAMGGFVCKATIAEDQKLYKLRFEDYERVWILDAPAERPDLLRRLSEHGFADSSRTVDFSYNWVFRLFEKKGARSPSPVTDGEDILRIRTPVPWLADLIGRILDTEPPAQ